MTFRLKAGLQTLFGIVFACVGLPEPFRRKHQRSLKLKLGTRWPKNAIQRRAGRGEISRQPATRGVALKIKCLFARRHTVGKTWACTMTGGRHRIVALGGPAIWPVAGNSVSRNGEIPKLPVFVNAANHSMCPKSILDVVPIGRRLEDELTRTFTVVTTCPGARVAADYTYASQQ